MKTHCNRGHLRIPDNLYKGGGCKKCRVDFNKAYRLDPEKRAKIKIYMKEYAKAHPRTPEQNKLASENILKRRREDPIVRQKYLIRHRNEMLKTTYGITATQYENILISQHYSCGVCGVNQSKFKKRLAVDHNHVTGQVRGLLCNTCNLVVVAAIENFSHLIEKAKLYLEKSQRPKDTTGYAQS